MLRFATVGASLSLFLLGCAGCSSSQIKVDGSSTVFPVTEAVVEAYSQEHPGARVVAGKSGTGGGMKKFYQGEIDICNASRAIKDNERQLCQQQGIAFIELSIAFDGLAVVIHPENDWCECLTVAQLKELWRPESEVRTWSDLDPAWPKEEIELFGPGTDSGTFDYFTEVIVGEEKSSRADYTASEDDNMLVSGVQSNRYALGYFGYAYYDKNKERLKVVGIDAGDGNCIKPSQKTVRDNSYTPLSRPLFIYVNKASLARPEVASFVAYYLESSSRLAEKVGYVPVSDEVASENEQRLAEALADVPQSASM
jgi:phosphate transport system substrate-binding protein